jgi:sugar phosphate isomerase/epimerase
MRPLKLCFSTLGCPGMGVEQVVALAVSQGMYGVEMRGKGPEDMLSPETPVSRRREIKQLFADSGLEMVGITGFVKFCETEPRRVQENLDTLERYAGLCAEMGAGYLRAYLGVPEDGSEIAARYPAVAEALDAAARRLQPYPVQLLLEMHDSLGTARQAAELFGYMCTEAPNLGIIWDTGNPVVHGEAPQETWDRMHARIGAVHLRDFVTTPEGKHKQVYPGEGELPMGEMVRVLAKGGYDGPAVIKWERVFDRELAPMEEALPVFARYIRKAWEE